MNNKPNPDNAFEVFAFISKKIPIKKSDILKYLVVSAFVSACMIYFFGANLIVLVVAAALQSVYFFGQKTLKIMFNLLLVIAIIILLSSLAFDVAIKDSNLAAAFRSAKKAFVTSISVDVDHPTYSLEARYQALLRQEVDLLLRANYNNPDGLLEAIDTTNQMENRLYNKIHGKTFPSQNSTNKQQSSVNNQQSSVNNQESLKPVDIQQFKLSGSGDTTQYSFVLNPQQSTKDISLVDYSGKVYGTNIVFTNTIEKITNDTTYILKNGQNYNTGYTPSFKLRGAANEPVIVNLKIFPVK